MGRSPRPDRFGRLAGVRTDEVTRRRPQRPPRGLLNDH